MKIEKHSGFISVVLLVFILSSNLFAQARTWYVNNQTGNDGRNGLALSIPTPDDGVTGPKRTLSGPQGALSEANAGDFIIVKNTGVQYSTATGEANTIVITKKITLRSTDGIPEFTTLFEQDNSNPVVAPGKPGDNQTIFDSGEFKLLGGLTLTNGVINNASQLLTVSGEITRNNSAATVSNQLKYTGTIDFLYNTSMVTGFEFPTTGTKIQHLTTWGDLTIKAGTDISMTGLITTAGVLNLNGGTVTVTNTIGGDSHSFGGDVTNGTLNFQLGGDEGTTQTLDANGATFKLPNIYVSTSNENFQTLAINGAKDITVL